MAIGVDDLLLAMATAAGKALGTELAKDLVEAITGNLATKRDLQIAVDAIEQYVHQEFMRVQAQNIVVSIGTVIQTLGQYQNSQNRQDLNEQNTQQLLNQTSQEISMARAAPPSGFGDDYLWQQFVPVCRYVGVNTAFWSIKVFELGEPNEVNNLISAISEGVTLLRSSLARIHAMEDEAISKLQKEEHVVRTRDNEGEGGPPVYSTTTNGHAWYSMYRGRYQNQNGVETRDTGWLLDTTADAAARRLQSSYDADASRIAKESADRNSLIYVNVNNTITALNMLIAKLGGQPAVALEKFGYNVKSN